MGSNRGRLSKIQNKLVIAILAPILAFNAFLYSNKAYASGTCTSSFYGVLGIAGAATIIADIPLLAYQMTGHTVAKEVDYVAAGINGVMAIGFAVAAFKCNSECSGTSGFAATSCWFAGKSTYLAMGTGAMAGQFINLGMQEAQKAEDLNSASSTSSVNSALSQNLDAGGTVVQSPFTNGVNQALDSNAGKAVFGDLAKASKMSYDDFKKKIVQGFQNGMKPQEIAKGFGYELPQNISGMPAGFSDMMKDPSSENLSKAKDMLQEMGKTKGYFEKFPQSEILFESRGGVGKRSDSGSDSNPASEIANILNQMGLNNMPGKNAKAEDKNSNDMIFNQEARMLVREGISAQKDVTLFQMISNRYNQKYRFVVEK